MQKHTPGPWRVGNNSGAVVSDSPEGLTINGATGATGATAWDHYGGHLIAESISPCNSNLIAAAPELLASLEEIMAYHGGADSALKDFYVAKRAKAAIAKAKGQPK